MAKKLVFSLGLAALAPIVAAGCTSPTVKPPTQQTWVDKMSAGVKKGTDKMVAAVAPKKPLPGSATTVSTAPSQPGPKVFVAAAQMHERTGNFEEAEANYRKALEIDAKNLSALIGYARLEDRRSNFDAATRLYRRAMKLHPKDATVHNDLGLCYHRRGMLNEAAHELKRAVSLDENNKLYRNNLAAAYVEQGKGREALEHLVAAHGQSVGNYNLAYLLMKKGDRDAALHYFQVAANMDHNLVAAEQWVAKLSAAPFASRAGGPQVAQTPRGGYPPADQSAYVAQRPVVQQGIPAQHVPAYAPHDPRTGAPPSADPLPPEPGRYR